MLCALALLMRLHLVCGRNGEIAFAIHYLDFLPKLNQQLSQASAVQNLASELANFDMVQQILRAALIQKSKALAPFSWRRL